jgi:hypothetical protein
VVLGQVIETREGGVMITFSCQRYIILCPFIFPYFFFALIRNQGIPPHILCLSACQIFFRFSALLYNIQIIPSLSSLRPFCLSTILNFCLHSICHCRSLSHRRFGLLSAFPRPSWLRSDSCWNLGLGVQPSTCVHCDLPSWPSVRNAVPPRRSSSYSIELENSIQ